MGDLRPAYLSGDSKRVKYWQSAEQALCEARELCNVFILGLQWISGLDDSLALTFHDLPHKFRMLFRAPFGGRPPQQEQLVKSSRCYPTSCNGGGQRGNF